jgi:hypothetical protein
VAGWLADLGLGGDADQLDREDLVGSDGDGPWRVWAGGHAHAVAAGSGVQCRLETATRFLTDHLS